MIIPPIEDRLIGALAGIERSISSIAHTLDLIDERKRFPITSPTEGLGEQVKERKKERLAEEQIAILHNQNNILVKTVIVAITSVVITAIVGVIDIILRFFYNK